MTEQLKNEPTIQTRTIKTTTTIHQSNDALSIAIANNIGTTFPSIALPLAAVIIARMFKSELAALLARLRSIKALGVEASLDAMIQEKLPPVVVSDQDEPLAEAQLSNSESRNPVEVIAASWLGVETALKKATATLPGASTMSIRSRAASLVRLPKTPTGLVDRIVELFNIKSRFLRYPDAIISGDSLMLYSENARRAIGELRAITPSE